VSRHSRQMPLLPHTDHAQEKADHSPQHSHQDTRLAQLEAHNHDRRAGQRCSGVDILPAPPAAGAPAASHPARGMTGASAVRQPAGLAHRWRGGGWLLVAQEKSAFKIPIRRPIGSTDFYSLYTALKCHVYLMHDKDIHVQALHSKTQYMFTPSDQYW
jgi:hypothetical protein